ncbi:ABC transporter ATP-binding protein [Deltaproteobacteria bacterium TL4]
MIDVKKIVKQFGKQRVLDELDVQIHPGDRIALIGQNGAGKTTLIRSLLGQYTHEGTLTLFGKDPRKSRVEVLDRIGFVPQHSPPIPMRLDELIHFSANISKSTKLSEIYQISEDLGLNIQANAKKPFFKLSGGMKQKLLIALALAKHPDLLIMDEPAANLDPAGRKAFFLKLAEASSNTTMILSSHRVDELLGLVNRVIEMDCGRIVFDEPIAAPLGGKLLFCRIGLADNNDALNKVLREWKLDYDLAKNSYQGSIAGVDRMRFLTAISHFSNHIQQLSME